MTAEAVQHLTTAEICFVDDASIRTRRSPVPRDQRGQRPRECAQGLTPAAERAAAPGAVATPRYHNRARARCIRLTHAEPRDGSVQVREFEEFTAWLGGEYRLEVREGGG